MVRLLRELNSPQVGNSPQVKNPWAREICGEIDVWIADKMCKRAMDLILMFGLNEAKVLLAMRIIALIIANSVSWYGNLLKRDDGFVLRKALEFEGQRKK